MAPGNRKRILIGALVAPILFLAYRYFIPDHAENSFSTPMTAPAMPPATDSSKAPSATTTERQFPGIPNAIEDNTATSSKEEEFHNKLKIESRKIGQVSDDPQQIERQLNNWASTFSELELKILQNEALSMNLPGDERFFSVDLLARNRSALTQGLLEEIVVAPLPTQFGSDPSTARSFEFELILRQRALDGVAEGDKKQALEAIKRVLQKTENPSIADRAHRHQAHLEGKAPTVVEQERQALQQLLKSQAGEKAAKE